METLHRPPPSEWLVLKVMDGNGRGWSFYLEGLTDNTTDFNQDNRSSS